MKFEFNSLTSVLTLNTKIYHTHTSIGYDKYSMSRYIYFKNNRIWYV